jgi:hypothetical protein
MAEEGGVMEWWGNLAMKSSKDKGYQQSERCMDKNTPLLQHSIQRGFFYEDSYCTEYGAVHWLSLLFSRLRQTGAQESVLDRSRHSDFLFRRIVYRL